ncbi:MAG TPA: hypothetical protein VLA62_08065, partial [Solirubrobacterales bacterium]|nr:hypothetical protein [Solirubrobacterales bacterium]
MRLGIDLRFELRNALFPLTELDRISACLREAEQLARRLDDRRRLGWVAAYMSSHLWMIGQSREMRTVADTLHETAEALGDGPLQIAANAYLGAACLVTGDYAAGERLLRANLELLEGELSGQRLGLTVFPAVNARARLAWCLAERGEFTDGLSLGEEALRMAETLDHPFSLVTACTLLAYLHRVRGQLGRAQPVLERGLALCEQWGVTLWAPILTASLGAVRAQSGDVGPGLRLIQEAMTQCEATGLGFFHTLIVIHRGEACALARRIGDALAFAEQALKLARQRGERGYEAWALRLLGDVESLREPADAGSARTLYERATRLAADLGMRPLAAHCHLGLGQAVRLSGESRESDKHFATAAGLVREMGMRPWDARTERGG